MVHRVRGPGRLATRMNKTSFRLDPLHPSRDSPQSLKKKRGEDEKKETGEGAPCWFYAAHRARFVGKFGSARPLTDEILQYSLQ